MDTTLSTVNLSDENRAKALQVLQRLPDAARTKWLENLVVEDRRVVGTYIGDIENILTIRQFRDLYEALGHDFSVLGTWYGYRKGIHGNCHYDPSYTCTTDKAASR